MRTRNALVLAAFLAMTASACRDDSPTGLAGTPRDGRVFIDNFISADFQAFGGSKLDAVQLDTLTMLLALRFMATVGGWVRGCVQWPGSCRLACQVSALLSAMLPFLTCYTSR